MPHKKIDQDKLRIQFEKPGYKKEPINQVPEHYVDLENIISQYQKTLRNINTQTNKCGISKLYDDLISFGTWISDELLPLEVKEMVGKIPEGEYLTIEIDDSLSHLPWELLCFDGQFLCERYNFGRSVNTCDDVSGINPRKLNNTYETWVIKNPTDDLPDTEKEAGEIRRLFKKVNGTKVKMSDATPSLISEKIKSYDFLHFTGHAEKDGLIFKEGVFRAFDDTRNMTGGTPMPYLIFANACESAYWKESENGSSGLANAFIRAGAMHYIGTSWKIISGPSKDFAIAFYKHLCDSSSIGEAVRKARLELKEKGGNTCWASYVHYGDPTDIIISNGEKEPVLNNILRISYIKKRDIPRENTTVTNISEAKVGKDLDRKGETNPDIKNDPKIKPDKKYNIKILAPMLIMIVCLTGFLIHYHEPDDQPLTLAVLVDDLLSDVLNVQKDYFVASAIEKQIIDKTHIKLLERRRLADLEREKLIGGGPVNWLPRKSGFLSARLMLYLYVNKSESKPYVIMDLIDTIKGFKIEIFHEQLENGKLVLAQKERLTEELLKTLKNKSVIAKFQK